MCIIKVFYMKKFLTKFVFAPILFLSNPLMAAHIKDQDKNWSHVLKTIPRGVANPLITKAVDLAFKSRPKDLKVIDLGAGTGRNISVLLKKGAKVYAYDASPQSIQILQKEYPTYLQEKHLFVFQKYFQDIQDFPKANLVIAWRSLSFMHKDDFPIFWTKMKAALSPGGIFTGTFFGDKHYTNLHSKTCARFTLSQKEVFDLFTDFKILHFQEEIEHDEEASRQEKCDQFEHIYRIVALKKHA